MLLDSAKIMNRDAMDLTKKFKKLYEPIYTEDDVYACLNNIEEYETGVKIKLEDDYSHYSNICESKTIICTKRFYIGFRHFA